MKTIIKILGFFDKAKTALTIIKIAGETIEFAKGRFEDEFKKMESKEPKTAK